MRLRQLISLSALAVMAYRSYGKMRKAKAAPGAASGLGLRREGRAGPLGASNVVSPRWPSSRDVPLERSSAASIDDVR